MKLIPRSLSMQKERAAVQAATPVRATQAPAPPVEMHPDDISHEIGARYEAVTQRIEDAVDIFEQIQPLSQIIEQIRTAVATEFAERRAEHGELLGMRSTVEQTRARLDDVERENRELSARIARTETELFETQARSEQDRRRLDAAMTEEQQLRADLGQSSGRVEQLMVQLKTAQDANVQLGEDRDALRDQLAMSEDRRHEADAAASRSNQQSLLAQEELAVLRKQLDTANDEGTRLSRQVTELDSLLGAERSRIRGLEASLASVQEEGQRASRAVEARLEATRIELTVANGKVETYMAQTAKLEGLNAEASTRLNETLAQQRATERQFAELQTDHHRSEDRVRTLEDELASIRVRLATVETARAAAVERSDQLSKQLHANEIALKRSEGRAAEMRERLEITQAENAQRRAAMEERLSRLESGMERERAERTIAEGALESLRRERSRHPAAHADTAEDLVASNG